MPHELPRGSGNIDGPWLEGLLRTGLRPARWRLELGRVGGGQLICKGPF